MQFLQIIAFLSVYGTDVWCSWRLQVSDTDFWQDRTKSEVLPWLGSTNQDDPTNE